MARTTRSISLQPELMFKIEEYATEMDFSFSEAVRELCAGALSLPIEKPDKQKEGLKAQKKALTMQLNQIEKELQNIENKEKIMQKQGKVKVYTIPDEYYNKEVEK